jgi:hypothetical protein
VLWGWRAARLEQHLGADGLADKFSDLATFRLEENKELAWLVTQKFIVSLPLGDDQIGSSKAIAQVLAALQQDGCRGIRAVVDDLHDPIKCHPLGILLSGLIEVR